MPNYANWASVPPSFWRSTKFVCGGRERAAGESVRRVKKECGEGRGEWGVGSGEWGVGSGEWEVGSVWWVVVLGNGGRWLIVGVGEENE